MGNVYAAFGTDKEATTDGVWHEFELNGEVICSILIRPQHPALNGEWRRNRLELVKKMRAYADEHHIEVEDLQTDLPEDFDVKITAEAYFGAIVTDWRDFDGPDGKAMKFTQKNFVKAMIDLPLLFDGIQARARKMGTYKKQLEADAVKS